VLEEHNVSCNGIKKGNNSVFDHCFSTSIKASFFIFLVFNFLSLGGLGWQFEWVIITYQVQSTSTCGLQLFGLFIIPFLRPSTMMWWRVEFGGSYGGVSESINGWVT